MSSTETVLNKLLNLNDSNDSVSEDYNPEENRTICHLLKIHFSDFFNNIYVPFKFFRKEHWNIRYVLDTNMDSLYYNEDYMNEEDKDKLEKIYKKYTNMIEEIMSPKNKLVFFLKKWTDMSGMSWKAKPVNSYLKSIITNAKYEFISPAHITEIY